MSSPSSTPVPDGETQNETNNNNEKESAIPAGQRPSTEKPGLLTQVYSALDVIKRRGEAAEASDTLETIPIPVQLLEALKEIIGEYNFLWADPCIHGKILNLLKFHFQNDKGLVTKFGDEPSDIENLIQFHPAEVISDKSAQIFSFICIGNVSNAFKELKNLKALLSNPLMGLHFKMEDGFLFVAKTLELFVQMMSGSGNRNVIFTDEDGTAKRPSFKALSELGKVAVKVVKTHFLRLFHYNTTLRINILKEATIEDPENAEWLVTLAEAARRRRRDNPYQRNRRPDNEEFEFVDKAYRLAPENPFVILCLMDCIIDCLRTKASFTCDGTLYEYSHDTVAFLKSTCRKLLKDYPLSVRIYSQVSDYFARFVPLRYFDVQFAGECLEHAYALNPDYPKTTHRKGIYFRMSRGALTTSFKWFQTTSELDPGHFNALMECIKNMLGRTKDYDVVEYIHKRLMMPQAAFFTEHEILEILFYEGIANFAQGNYEGTLELFKVVSAKEQEFFRLSELDQLSGYYNWDVELISTDKLRLWINGEKERLIALGSAAGPGPAGDGPTPDKDRLKLVTSLYNLMIGYEEPGRPNRGLTQLTASPTYTGYVLVRNEYKANAASNTIPVLESESPQR